jgi:hypothetical protein
LGSGAILRLKRPADRSIGIDTDPGALAAVGVAVPAGTELIEGDGIAWLASHAAGLLAEPRVVVYCDPPYFPGSTRSRLRYGAHNLDADQHHWLLAVLGQLRCHVLISGYQSTFYDWRLAAWRRVDYKTMTRGGTTAVESLWCNFAEPTALHDYRYLGESRDGRPAWRERQKFRRQQRRWARRLARMSVLQRRALLAAIADESSTPTP